MKFFENIMNKRNNMLFNVESILNCLVLTNMKLTNNCLNLMIIELLMTNILFYFNIIINIADSA